MNTTMTHYEFKEEKDGELLTPWADPKSYEDPFDYHFLTVEEAIETKKERAPTEEWVLVKVTTEILKHDVVFPACAKCGDEGEVSCGTCAGSGEGMYDGSRCSSCRGSGTESCGCVGSDDDDRDHDSDRAYDEWRDEKYFGDL